MVALGTRFIKGVVPKSIRKTTAGYLDVRFGGFYIVFPIFDPF